MLNFKIIRLAICTISGLFIFAATTNANTSDILEIVKIGVGQSENVIENISFDYTIDYDISEEWRNEELQHINAMVSEDIIDTVPPRVMTLEHTLRSGSAVFEGNKFNINLQTQAVSDQKIFQDISVVYDDTKLTELDFIDEIGYISSQDEVEIKKSNLMFDPRNFPLFFIDGQKLSSMFASKDTTIDLIGTEEIDGTNCYIIDLAKKFISSDGTEKEVKRKCWIAPDKGYLIKKAIAYSIKSPDKPLSITDTKISNTNEGLWYYSEITFQSFPLLSSQPDVIAILNFSNVEINQQLKQEAFTYGLSKIKKMYDTINNLIYSTEPIPPSE